MTKERLLAFARAWSGGDINKVMQFFEEDCVYQPSVRNSDDRPYRGKPEVRKAIAQIMDFDKTSSAKVENIFIKGDFGFWEWEYVTVDGTKTLGCDVFLFQGNRIVSKNAFRKLNYE